MLSNPLFWYLASIHFLANYQYIGTLQNKCLKKIVPIENMARIKDKVESKVKYIKEYSYQVMLSNRAELIKDRVCEQPCTKMWNLLDVIYGFQLVSACNEFLNKSHTASFLINLILWHVCCLSKHTLRLEDVTKVLC